jgi:D-glycero-D-manno-heptose 1,7-bisphosphate phosphatase
MRFFVTKVACGKDPPARLSECEGGKADKLYPSAGIACKLLCPCNEGGSCMRPAIFLDRDGVIIENCEDYVRSWDDVCFIEPAIRALRQVAPLDVAVVVVTNQAVVGKGLITLDEAERINNRVVSEMRRRGGRIDRAYLCPHASDSNCDCRKPKPGMLLRAAQELDIDLAHSFMVGDAITDMQAAQAAGVGSVIVRTGRGERELARYAGEPWFDIADDLLDAFATIQSLRIAA